MTARAWPPAAGEPTLNPTFCGRCRFLMEAGDGVYTVDGDRIGARHQGDCPPPLTVAEIAAAAAISPADRRVNVGDPAAAAELSGLPPAEAALMVMAAHQLNQMPAGPRRDRCRLAARALLRAITTGRLNPAAAARIRGYTPWRVCELVALVSGECRESELGMMCDSWICGNHETL